MTEQNDYYKSTIGSDEKFCHNCGNVIRKSDKVCSFCGAKQYVASDGQKPSNTRVYAYPPKERIIYVLLALFLGTFGVHNFYAGYSNTAVKQLLVTILTGWIFGIGVLITYIWAIVDIIQVTQDANGVPFR